MWNLRSKGLKLKISSKIRLYAGKAVKTSARRLKNDCSVSIRSMEGLTGAK